MKWIALLICLANTAWGAISLVSHTWCAPPTGVGYCTTAAVNDTGVNLIVIGLSDYPDISATVTDSHSNVYTPLTRYGNPPYSSTRLFYKVNPVVGTSDTFTVNGGHFPSITVAAFSGALANPFVLDFEIGNNAAGSSISPGAITPATTGDVLVTVWTSTSTTVGTLGINLSFIPTDRIVVGGSNYETMMAYLITSATSPINPTWTNTGGGGLLATSMVAFHSVGVPAHKMGTGTGVW